MSRSERPQAVDLVAMVGRTTVASDIFRKCAVDEWPWMRLGIDPSLAVSDEVNEPAKLA